MSTKILETDADEEEQFWMLQHLIPRSLMEKRNE